MFKKIIYLLFILFLFNSCSNTKNSDNRQIISVTIEPLKYFVDQISGEEYAVNVIVPTGASPETYEPSIKAMRKFENSELFFSIGLLDCEQSISSLSKKSKVKTIILKDSISLLEGVCSHHDHDHGGNHTHHHSFDPHIWSGIDEAKVMSNIIAQNLSEINPSNSDLYSENLKTLTLKIDSLDSYIRDKFSSKTERKFVIFHPAFTYYAQKYSLTQISIEEDGKEGSIRQLKDIIKEHGDIKAVLYQKEFSKSSVESICREINARAIEVDPLVYNWLTNMYEITDKLHESMN